METLTIHMSIEDLGWSADALDRLTQLREAKELLDYLIEQAVIECRTNAQQETTDVVGNETRKGSTSNPIAWQKIADALKVSRQTAWERFAHLIED